MKKRVFLTVCDSFGCGEAPDSYRFGDVGVNTLKGITKSPYFCMDNLKKMGFGNIDGCDFLGKTANPTAKFGRLREKSAGKDTTVGHWELAGVVSGKPLPTYPNGFPDEIIKAFSEAVGRGVLCNKPYSGTQVIADYGAEHLKTGKLIVYTSADSVFQIAAHEDIVPVETLYEYCRAARVILTGENGVGRVIARPFAGQYPNFYRTAKRRDFSVEPSGETLLDRLKSKGFDVISVGKIYDIFAGRGITESYQTHSNAEGMQVNIDLLKREYCGLCFTNLVDFDMAYGHRRDVDGYARAVAEFDAWLPSFTEGMREGDLLIVTADHGCDPTYTRTTDHTREYVPLLVYGRGIEPENLGTLDGFDCVADMIFEYLS